MMHTRHIPTRKRERGFTVLFAALIASLVLTLGASIFSIAQKQVILSSLGRNSQYAFYAADTGAECALYWDVRFQRFPTTTIYTSPVQVACNGADINANVVDEGAGVMTSDFSFEINGYCSQVSVRKAPTDPTTVIHADGFSTTCADIATAGRTLQRSVELSY